VPAFRISTLDSVVLVRSSAVPAATSDTPLLIPVGCTGR